MLADEAVVTVKGAKELSLRQPIQLRLPFSSTNDDGNPISNLIELSMRLKRTSSDQGKPSSLQILSPSSLAASSINEPDSTGVYRVEISSTQVFFEAATNLISTNDMWMWPLPSLSVSDPKLHGIEELLNSILAPLSQKNGSIKLVEAQAAAVTFVKVQVRTREKSWRKNVLSRGLVVVENKTLCCKVTV